MSNDDEDSAEMKRSAALQFARAQASASIGNPDLRVFESFVSNYDEYYQPPQNTSVQQQKNSLTEIFSDNRNNPFASMGQPNRNNSMTPDQIGEQSLKKLEMLITRLKSNKSVSLQFTNNTADASQLVNGQIQDYEQSEKELVYRNELANHAELLEYLKKSFYFPLAIKNIESKTFTKYIKLPVDPRSFDNTIVLQFPTEQFKSHENYCQGARLQYLDPPEGNTSNVYMGAIKLINIRYNGPYPIGVKIFSALSSSETIPYSGASESAEEGNFDFVIPPSFNSDKEILIFKSTKGINHPYGIKYPNLTYDPKSFYGDKNLYTTVRDAHQKVSAHTVSVIAPIVEVTCARHAHWKKESPLENIDTLKMNNSPTVTISADTYAMAEKELFNITKFLMSVKDLSHLRISLTLLANSEAARLDILKANLETLSFYAKSTQPGVPGFKVDDPQLSIYNTAKNIIHEEAGQNILKECSLFLKFEFTYGFRETYSDFIASSKNKNDSEKNAEFEDITSNNNRTSSETLSTKKTTLFSNNNNNGFSMKRNGI